MDKDKGIDSIVHEAQERFKYVLDADNHNRLDALDDLRFARLGEQWPADVKKIREKEGRPCLTINRLPSFIRQVVNDSRQNKPSIKCHPIDDNADIKTADILNGIIRNIEVSSNADIAYDTAIDFAVTCGFGYFRITTDYARDDTFDMDILINRVTNPFTVYADPDATEGDGSDWNYCFVTEWMDRDDFKVKWPKADVTNWSDSSQGDTDQEWLTEDKVRVAEYWCREEVEREIYQLSTGMVVDADEYNENIEMYLAMDAQVINQRLTKSWKVTQHWIAGDQLLDSVDWAGQYIPIVPVYGDEINIEGKVYYQSMFRHAKDAQRMFNYWRTTSTELVALAPKAPFIGKTGSFDTDIDKWNTANVKSHAFLEFDGDYAPQRSPFAGVPAGALQEAMNASDDMKSIMGVFDASLGAKSNETSGKAIMARQREGDNSTFHFIDNMSRAIRQAGRILVDLIPKVYDKPRVMRIIGEDEQPKNVKVNQPFQDNGIERIYDLKAGKYDVTVHSGPSFTTRREEAVTAITEMVRSYPDAAPILGDVLVKMMDFPNADKISKRLAAMLPPQIQKMEQEDNGIPQEAQALVMGMEQQLQQQQQKMQEGMQFIQQLQQENEKLKGGNQADLMKIQMDMQMLQTKIQAELQKAQMDNETRLKVAMMSHADKDRIKVNDAGELEEKPESVKRKRISIQAPSGQIYRGLVEDEEVMPEGSGEVDNG